MNGSGVPRPRPDSGSGWLRPAGWSETLTRAYRHREKPEPPTQATLPPERRMHVATTPIIGDGVEVNGCLRYGYLPDRHNLTRKDHPSNFSTCSPNSKRIADTSFSANSAPLRDADATSLKQWFQIPFPEDSVDLLESLRACAPDTVDVQDLLSEIDTFMDHDVASSAGSGGGERC